MPSKIKRLYRYLIALLHVPDTVTKINNNVSKFGTSISNIALSPVDQYVFFRGIYGGSELYEPFFEGWKIRRIDKILELYGIDFFKNKSVLELGCGHGDIGAFFSELGANVLGLDGRIQNVNLSNLKYRKVNNFKCLQFNLENDFTEFGKFDLIINFGLLYHLKNVTDHLNYCFRMSDDIILESAVCDSTDPHKIFFKDEDKTSDVDALEGIGSRPSPFYVERIAQENNFEAIRCFTPDLNYDDFLYDWDHKNDNSGVETITLRRCWRFKKI